MKVISTEELKTEKILKRIGVPVLVPTMGIWRLQNRYAKRKKHWINPVMTGYAFVGIVNDEAWLALSHIRLIYGVVGFNGRPLQLDQLTVECVRARHLLRWFDPPNVHRYMRTHEEFDIGDHVRVIAGALAGKEYAVETIENESLKIVETWMGSQQTHLIPLDQVVRSL